MSIDEIFFFEVNGLIDTINEYTRDHYVRNYTNLLKSKIYQEDKEVILYLVNRLIEWYKCEIVKIRDNNHIYNIKEHEKSYMILKEIQSSLQ